MFPVPGQEKKRKRGRKSRSLPDYDELKAYAPLATRCSACLQTPEAKKRKKKKELFARSFCGGATPSSRRDRGRRIVSNAKRFQRGEWKGLWETALRFAQKEADTKAKRNHNRAKHDTSIQARVVYAEHCARRRCTFKANQAIASDLLPNSGPPPRL